VLLREARFVRLEVESTATTLKVEMVNDVPAHVGDVTPHPRLGRLLRRLGEEVALLPPPVRRNG